MEIQYFGANCVRLTTKSASVVVDDNLANTGLKPVTKPADISLRTNSSIPEAEAHFTANMPGEYEVSGVSIHGIAARGHMEEEGQMGSVIYVVSAGEARVAILGHIYPELSDEQVEQIGHVDVAIVPVGDSGYTMDGIGALKVIKKIEPKTVIPTHYADKAVKYEVPQVELAEALKGLAMEPSETTAKFKATAGDLGEATKLVLLERQ